MKRGSFGGAGTRGPSWGGAATRGASGAAGGGGSGRGSWGGAPQRAMASLKITAEQKRSDEVEDVRDADSDSCSSGEEDEDAEITNTKPVQLSYVPQKARAASESSSQKQQPSRAQKKQPPPSKKKPIESLKPQPKITSSDEKQVFDFGDGARVVYYPRFLDKATADAMFEDFLKTIPWDEKDVYVEGVGWVPQPRLVAWMSSDKSFEYTYNSITLQPNKPTPLLIELQRRIEAVTPGCQYDGTLINLYRNGKDSIAAHSDAEDTLVSGSTIASISLGCERSFILRPKHKVGSPTEIRVKHGSLLLMEGTLQRHYVHEVPKDFKLCLTHYGPDKYGLCDCPQTKRINLTMRHYKPPSSNSTRRYAIKISE